MRTLLKIAEEMSHDDIAYELEDDDIDRHIIRSGKAGLLGAGVAAGGVLTRDNWVGNTARDWITNPHGTDAQIRDLQKMRPGVSLKRHKNTSERMMKHGPSYSPMDRTVHLADVPRVGVAAHEFGHAHKQSLPFRANNYLMGSSMKAMLPSGAIGVALGASDDKNIRHVGKALPWLTFAPVLAEEARANIHGWRALNKLDMSTKDRLKAKGDLVKSFGLYATIPAAFTLGNYAAGKYKDYLNKKRLEERQEEDEDYT